MGFDRVRIYHELGIPNTNALISVEQYQTVVPYLPPACQRCGEPWPAPTQPRCQVEPTSFLVADGRRC